MMIRPYRHFYGFVSRYQGGRAKGGARPEWHCRL
jgi:hypothetical protein